MNRSVASTLARVEAKARRLQAARKQQVRRAEAAIARGAATRRDFEIAYPHAVEDIEDVLRLAVEDLRHGGHPEPSRRGASHCAAIIVTSPPEGEDVAEARRELERWAALHVAAFGEGDDQETGDWVRANAFLIHLERNEEGLRSRYG